MLYNLGSEINDKSIYHKIKYTIIKNIKLYCIIIINFCQNIDNYNNDYDIDIVDKKCYTIRYIKLDISL